jgi:hypothetical protein
VAPKLSASMVDAFQDSLIGMFVEGGTLRIYAGTRPASTDGAATTLLATVNLVGPAFHYGSSGVANLADPDAVNAVASGTATWFRATSEGGVFIFDGSVSVTGGGGDLQLESTALLSGQPVDITVGTVTFPRG